MASGKIKRLTTITVAIAVLASAAGCYSHSYGTALDPNKVSQIQKHVTTRAQVEALLGAPMNVSMTGDGRRTMMYTHVDTETHAKATTYIPVVSLFASGARGEQHTQTLQIMLNKDDVVEDYEFNNNTKNIDSTGGVQGFHSDVTDAPTPAPSSK